MARSDRQTDKGEDNKRWYYVDGVPTCLAFRDRKAKRKRYSKKPDKNQMLLFEPKEV